MCSFTESVPKSSPLVARQSTELWEFFSSLGGEIPPRILSKEVSKMWDDTTMRIIISKKEHEVEAMRNDRNRWKELAQETMEGNNFLLKEVRRLEKRVKLQSEWLEMLGGNE